jgi:hypothetical protein
MRRDVSFVRSRRRFPAAENIQESADDARVGGDEHEAPFQDGGFRSRADVDSDEQYRCSGENEPQQHDAVEHFHEPLIGPVRPAGQEGPSQVGLRIAR